MDYVPDLMDKMNQMFNQKVKSQSEKTEKIIEEIKKNTRKYQTNPEFTEKDFETKSSEDFNLKDDISTDVKEDINYEIKRQEAESDGEDF